MLLFFVMSVFIWRFLLSNFRIGWQMKCWIPLRLLYNSKLHINQCYSWIFDGNRKGRLEVAQIYIARKKAIVLYNDTSLITRRIRIHNRCWYMQSIMKLLQHQERVKNWSLIELDLNRVAWSDDANRVCLLLNLLACNKYATPKKNGLLFL